MAEKSYTAFNAMVDIVASPAKAFDGIKSHNSWFWWPLLIAVGLACGALAYYYSWVDFEWLIDYTLENKIAAEDRAASESAIRSFMSPSTSTITSVVAIAIVSVVFNLLFALYYHLANKVTAGADLSFGQWFNFSVWINFVGIVASLAAFMVIFTSSTNQIPEESLQVFSINSLILHARPTDPWFTWGSALNLTHLWIIFLGIIGFARWTGSSTVKSAIVVVLPFLAIFGTWAALV